MRKTLLRLTVTVLLSASLLFAAGCERNPDEPFPTGEPTATASATPTENTTPTGDPSPSAVPTNVPTDIPTDVPTDVPTVNPTTPPPQEGVGLTYPGSGENARYVIVVDAGHQAEAMTGYEPVSPGSDERKMQVTAGTTGTFTGTRESELNLAVALAVRDELIEKGYTVVMVRETENVSVSNRERALLANEVRADVLLHIHANGAAAESAGGALAICQTAQNPANGSLYPESRRLSDCVLAAYCRATGLYARPVEETDGMTGINWASVPATILEMGFMTNPVEDAYMATDAFKLSAARGIAEGIETYLRAKR